MTKPVTIESRFADFQRTGDPEALAAVFDASAPKLLMLAVHMTRDEVRAEDLVQATFVKVIERADQYEATRPFLPWISAVLANEVRMHWRSDGKSPDPHRLPPRESEDPAALAEATEASEVLTQAVDQLPETYRVVLRLKLLHGLKHADIARTLDIPPETVRTKVSRGLDKLKQMLPAGLAGAAMMLIQGRGLAAVRSAVLAKAREAAPVAGFSVLSKAWIVVLLLAGAVGFWGMGGLWNLPPAAANPGTVTNSNDSTMVQEDTAKEDTASGLPGLVRVVVPPAARTGREPSDRWLLRGTVRDAAGQPVAGAKVTAQIIRGCEARALASVHSAADGSYQIWLEPLDDLSAARRALTDVLVVAEARGFWPDEGEFLERVALLHEGPQILQQDLRLYAGVVLRGRVVDSRGRPGGESWVKLENVDSGASVQHRTDPHGGFVIALERAGNFRLLARGPSGVGVKELGYLAKNRDTDCGDVPIEPHGLVVGRLVSASRQGLPFQHLKLRRLGMDPNARRRQLPEWHDDRLVLIDDASANTGAKGRFEIAGLAPGEYELEVRDLSDNPQTFRVHTGAPAAEIVVKGQQLQIKVQDGTRTPMPGIAVQYRGFGSEADWRSGVRPIADGSSDVRFQPGIHHLLLPESSFWKFRVTHWAFEPVAVDWQVHPGRDVGVLRMVLRPATTMGRLELDFVDDAGDRIVSFELVLSEVGSVHDAVTISSVGLRGRRTTPPLPVGEYRATFYPGPGDFRTRIPYMPKESRVVVRAKQTTRLSLQVQLGGYLAVRVHAPRGDPTTWWNNLRTVLVPDDGGKVQDLFHCWHKPKGSRSWSMAFPTPVNTELRSYLALVPGQRRIRITADGFRPAEQTVVIERGKTTTIDVYMQRR